jgi:hypothetical protein
MSQRKISVAVAAFAALALMVSGADAAKRKQTDPAIQGTAFWVGAATTGAGFAFDNLAAGAGVSGAGCVFVSPLVAMAVTKRRLTNREANYMFASCIIPVVGGWLMNVVYDNGWLTPPDEVGKVHHRRKKAAAR